MDCSMESIWTCPWNPWWICLHSIWNPWCPWNNELAVVSANIHSGFHMELLMDSIWINPGKVKTSESDVSTRMSEWLSSDRQWETNVQANKHDQHLLSGQVDASVGLNVSSSPTYTNRRFNVSYCHKRPIWCTCNRNNEFADTHANGTNRQKPATTDSVDELNATDRRSSVRDIRDVTR